MNENNIPVLEPERQQYFISCLNDMIHKWIQDNGHRPSYHIETYGCQMNARDSEKLSGILSEIGFEETDSEDADFVLFNTCTVRENANEKLYGHLGIVKHKKETNKNMLIAVCGCMMQEPDEVKRIKESMHYVDIVFGTHNIYMLAELLYKRLTEKKQVVSILDKAENIVEDIPNKRKYDFKSGVNIMYGCNNFCSYCIVPYVRGRERSRKPEDIICEIKRLVKDGVVEIMLLGQNVNSYGLGLDSGITFAKLLSMVCEIEGLKRVRFMTSHPKDLSDELIEAMSKNPKICMQLHLPLQSGSSRILKAMNRKYTKEDYLSLVGRIRENLPDISLTTDIIVGFPGESEEDFKETLDVVEKVGYDSAFTFIYSKRTGTPAASMEDQIPEDIVKERFDRLLSLVKATSAKRIDRFTGRTLPVLVEDINSHIKGYVSGRLSSGILVHFEGDESLIGSIVNVRLDELKGFYYMGHRM